MSESSNEFYTYGVPGGGKTTWIAKSVASTVKKRGPSKVMVVSFTRTGAHEIANRGYDGQVGKLPIPPENVGTLHSMAYRAIGRPTVYSEHIGDWNNAHREYAMGGGGNRSVNLDEPLVEQNEATEGSKLLGAADVLRSRMTPIEEWPTDVRTFYDKWTDWLGANELIDFTGMIERALAETDYAPCRPEVAFMDEAQDATALELALFKKWGEDCDRIIFAGDDDQAIFTFRGATPDGMLDPRTPESDKKVLSQSYRLPAEVLRVSDAWVQRLSHRQPKDPKPRDAEGSVSIADFTIRQGLEFVADIEKRVDSGQSVMVLTACSYQLDDVKAALRERGLPFHNPYRPSRGDWNPMKVGSGQYVSAADRLIAYMSLEERDWTGKDVKEWTEYIRAKDVLRRGAKGIIKNLPDGPLPYETVADLFVSEEALAEAAEPSLEWFRSHLTAAGDKALQFPITVLKARGLSGITEEPRVTIGTIHSAKGAQSDVVYLAPDLSHAGMKQWQGTPEEQDSVIRQWYVGMTRAREDLIVLRPSGRASLQLEELVPGV